MTKGEERVRVTFNPSNQDYVFQLKSLGAQMINLIEEHSTNQVEVLRLKALAMTAIEEGTMWAVKMATS